MRETLHIVVHVLVVHPGVVLHQLELFGHADDGAAELPVNHLEVFAPEVVELLHDLLRETGLRETQGI